MSVNFAHFMPLVIFYIPLPLEIAGICKGHETGINQKIFAKEALLLMTISKTFLQVLIIKGVFLNLYLWLLWARAYLLLFQSFRFRYGRQLEYVLQMLTEDL